MPYPNEVETGADETEKARIGLAGPTADIRHLEVHEATGMPAMFTALQQSVVGTGVPLNTWNPTWSGTGSPSTNLVRWRMVGAVVFVLCDFAWDANHTGISSGFLWDGDYPTEWGTVLGATIPGRGVSLISSSTKRPLRIELRGTIQGMTDDLTTAALTFFQAGDSFYGSGVVMLA